MVPLELHRQYARSLDVTEKCLGFEIVEAAMVGCGVPHVIGESEHVGKAHIFMSLIYHCESWCNCSSVGATGCPIMQQVFLNFNSTPDSGFNKLVRQAHFVCYIEYFTLSNIKKKSLFYGNFRLFPTNQYC